MTRISALHRWSRRRRSSGRSRRSHSFRPLLAGLLAHHVLGVPVWPVRVGLPCPRLVLPVGGRGAPKRARQIVRRREGRRRGVNATGQPRRDFLEQPAVAVRITERGERAVAAMLAIRTADPEPPKQVGLVRAGVHAAGVVENLRRAAARRGRRRCWRLSGTGPGRSRVLRR